MKKILFLFLFSVLYSLSFGQNTQYFNKLLFPNISTNSLQSVIKADSNYFVLYGWLDTPYVDKQGIGLLKLDLSGNIVKSKLIKDSTINYFNYPGNSLIYTSDSCLIIAAVLEDTLFKDHSILIKTNKNLDIIWTKEFSHPDTIAASQSGAEVIFKFNAVRQTYDGGYIIAGNYNPNCNTTYHNMYLLKTDSLGDFQWIKKYSTIESTFDIELATDSGFFFPAAINNKLNIVKVNYTGDILWTKNFNNKSNPSFPVNLVMDNSNNMYIVSSFWYDINLYKSAITITKINLTFQNTLWEKNYYPYVDFRCYSLHQSVELELTDNNDIIISSNALVINPADTNTSEFKGFLMKVNSNGDSLWSRYFVIGDFEDKCQFNDLVLTDDGGFLAVGYHYAYHPGIMYQDAWIVKMDSFGCDTPGCQSVGLNELKVESGRLKVYPNPAHSTITIERTENKNLPEGVLQLFDEFGKLIKEVEIPKNKLHFELNINDLNVGLYMGQLTGSEGKSFSFKFVKE